MNVAVARAGGPGARLLHELIEYTQQFDVPAPLFARRTLSAP